MEKMNAAIGKMKMLVGMDVEDDEEESAMAAQQDSSSFAFVDDFNRNCTLSTKQRLYGFVTCLVAGIACTLLSGLLRGRIMNFDRIQCQLVGIVVAIGICCYLDTQNLLLLFESMLVFFNPIKFGVTFSFGNLLALGSTAFLIGPKRQMTMMLDPARIYATAIYLASVIIALFCALYVRNKLLTLLAVLLEFGALIWYFLIVLVSYIPLMMSVIGSLIDGKHYLILLLRAVLYRKNEYSLSYIPFARSLVTKVMVACFDTEF